MKGKVVNFCMALLNLLVGLVIVMYSIKIPREITELTVQEYKIVSIIKIIINITFCVITLLNIINYFLNQRDSLRKTGFLIAVFSIAFLFIKEWPIAIFSILGALIIIIATARERWVETNSITMISIIGVIAVCLCISFGACFVYKSLGTYILEKENANEMPYKEDYFKYVTELGIEEPYINVKKDGKYGYITKDGKTVIDFQFEYASPFVPIKSFDKNFEIALVCKDGSTWIILKNLRKVLTYRSVSMDEDYEAKIKELEDIYYNTLDQQEDMHFEIETKKDNIYKVKSYPKEDDSNSYRYDYNDKYDVVVTKSSLGFGDTYELASKENLDLKIELECEKLCYDENYLYIYSNGTIPFYNIQDRKQGWFTGHGNNKVTLSGKAQILEIMRDNILIKNHNDNTTYFIDKDGNKLSDVYKEIFIINENRYIVKLTNNKYTVIDKEFNKVSNDEWDFVDTTLISNDIIIFGTSKDAISFNDYDYAENMNLKMVDFDGNTLADNLQQIYTKYYYISSDNSKAYTQRYSEFLDSLKIMESKFVGDEFYK